MRKVISVALLGVAGSVLAADSSQYNFLLTVKAGDAEPVSINAALPPGTKHSLQATEHLVFQVETQPLEANGRGLTKVLLIDDSSGKPVTRATDHRMAPFSFTRTLTYTVCGERVMRPAQGKTEPAKCSDLPSLAPVDPTAGKCYDDCLAPYEAMPDKLSARSRIAPAGEPGEPMVLTGRTLGPDGKPRAGVIVYAYQTDAGGVYPPSDPPRSMYSDFHGKLRGWALTDANGRYTFDTIRPGGYPNGGEPQHVHMHVVERGCAAYVIDELLFSDDPRLTPEMRERIVRGFGGNPIVTPRKEGKVWKVERDIHLGEKIDPYPGCSARR
jgi:protocatechuate 3,4-dioxygenase beta subunit